MSSQLCLINQDCGVSLKVPLKMFLSFPASQDYWNEGVHTWSWPEGGGPGLEYKVGLTHFSLQSCLYRVKSVFMPLNKCLLWWVSIILTSTPYFAVMTAMWTLTLLWRSQSQLVSKDFQWATHFSIFFASSSSTTSYVFTGLVKTVLNLPAQGDDKGHFRAAYWWCTTGGRNHLLFHSPPCECIRIFSLELLLSVELWRLEKCKTQN